MNKKELVARVRVITRDFKAVTFRDEDILAFLNEGIDRCRQLMKEFDGMEYLEEDTDVPVLLPSAYHSLLTLFSASRCFLQDERAYQSTTFMNEFETKFDELRIAVEDGRVEIKDTLGNVVTGSNDSFYVEDNYFEKQASSESFDYPEDDGLPTDVIEEPATDEVITVTLDGGEF